MNNKFSLLITILVISVFCPYLMKSSGIRFEHLIVYPMFALMLLNGFVNRLKINSDIVPIIFLWSGFSILVSLRTFLSPEGASLSNMLADLDNFLQPLALMTFFLFRFEIDSQNLINRVIVLVNTFLSLNAVLIIISFLTDVSFITNLYWRGEVAINSLSNGRYVGIFNQPLESGMAYSIGVMGWLYIIEKQSKMTIWNLIVLILLVVGGITSVSKVFLLGGFPLFLLGAMRNKGVRKSIIGIIFILLPTMYGAYFFLRTSWYGFDYLKGIVMVDGGNILQTFTSGRFGGDNGSMEYMFGNVWDQHPIIGLGLGMNPIVDSQWFEFFGTGGSLGLSILVMILLVLIGMANRYLRIPSGIYEAKLFIVLVMICIGGSIGAPVFTVNRASTILWLLLCLISHKLCQEQIVRKEKRNNLVLAKSSL